MSEHFDALETRDPEQRESALMKALAAQVAHARAHAPAGAARFAEWASSPVDSRAALARLPVLRKHELHERQRAGLASDAFGGFSAIGWGARRRGPARQPRLRLARADPRARERAARLLADGSRPLRRRLSRRRPGAQQLQLSLHARRHDDGQRRGGDRLHRLSGRHRPDRAAAAGDGRPEARRLRRHAELPAHPAREGRRDRHPPAVAEEGLARRRSLSRHAARLAGGARHRRLPELRHGRPRPRRLRDRGARGPGRRRRRDRRDREPGHRRSGRRGRGRRAGGDDAQSRLSADPSRHRRPLGGAAGAAARPAAPTSASAAGSAAPTSRPRCAACSSIRPRWPRSRAAIPR